MISIDTNILFAAVDGDHALHSQAADFIDSLADRSDIAISELVLTELYILLRNSVVMREPLAASAAVDVCESFRHHPRWQIIGFPPDSRLFHNTFWPRLRTPNFARRRAFDWRIALSLIQQGVTEFATVNEKDFQGFGFNRVWDPLAATVG
ncbi:type II toxin-antitoxin system VapC family toxin [Prosthecobacter sp.]|uniref:type II toxin-antitoxin system VapC family toxin n=1 Tax=Prosthecobacter sp. TaxID=1965333 RepID=UPI00378372BC